jgi:hypothetical protein
VWPSAWESRGTGEGRVHQFVPGPTVASHRPWLPHQKNKVFPVLFLFPLMYDIQTINHAAQKWLIVACECLEQANNILNICNKCKTNSLGTVNSTKFFNLVMHSTNWLGHNMSYYYTDSVTETDFFCLSYIGPNLSNQFESNVSWKQWPY